MKSNKVKKNKKYRILVLQTSDWNKTSKSQQDKELLFMYRILAELDGHRKVGIDKSFWASRN